MIILKKNKNLNFVTNLFSVFTIFLFVMFFNKAEAASSGILLVVQTLDGQSVNNVVNGEPLILSWYISIPVTNCLIFEKVEETETVVQAIDTTSLPASGTKNITPSSNVNTSYILRCDTIEAEQVINTNQPTVSMSIDQGTDLMVNPLTGRVDMVDVRWTSANANRCSQIWREKASAPGVLISEDSTRNYWYRGNTSGRILYNGVTREIRETTTFYITCYNDDIEASVTDSITLNVTNPAPPAEPNLSIWSPDYPSVTVDTLWGYAWVNVGFSAQNVTSCSQSALNDNGEVVSNPPGWGGISSGYTNYNFTGIKIAATTEFKVTCTRGAVTIAGIDYPAVSVSKTVKIMVLPPAGVDSLETWDRATLPPVTVTISATPNPTDKNSLTGLASTDVTVERANATFCSRSAYYTNGTPDDYTDDGSPFNLSGWSSTLRSMGSDIFTLNLSTSTRLSVYCVREYDLAYGTDDEIANGTELASTVVITIDPSESAPDPTVELFANAVIINANTMWNTATEKIGFNNIAGTPQVIENNAATESDNKISFPFRYPFGDSDKFDIYLKVCDENDGQSVFELSTASNGSIGNFMTDSLSATSDSCNTQTTVYKKIGNEVEITDGELITVRCNTPADGERCRLSEVLFGVDGIAVTQQINPVVTSVSSPLLWLSENTTSCSNNWDRSTAIRGFTTPNNINSSKTFNITCVRGGDSLTAADSVQVFVPYSDTLSAEVAIAVGQCIDDGSLGGSFGQAIEAPPGYGAGPAPGRFCVPLVDLAVEASSLNIDVANPDGIKGTYDNVPLRLVIKNLGPLDLSADSQVPYKFTLTNPIYNSPLSYFNGSLVALQESPVIGVDVDGIKFGNHYFCSRVNLDGVLFPENTNDGVDNNQKCFNVSIPVPEPPMEITADGKPDTLIRRGKTVTISWMAHTSYPTLECIVKGPGGISDSFNASDNHPQPYVSSQTVNITSKSEFMLQCTESTTGTVFTKKAYINVVPDYEEL